MEMEKRKEIDQIVIEANGCVIFREATSIIEGSNILAKTYHRTTLAPGDDLTNVPSNVADICRVTWTEEKIQAYQDSWNRSALESVAGTN